jgi:hypothetical protein
MKIPRIYDDLSKYIEPNKALIIFGPRQVGKTILLNGFLKNSGLKYRLDSGDDINVSHILSSSDFKEIKAYAAGYDLIALDEAHKIPNVGQGLKILVDQVPGLKIIATGSSSFELAGQIGEPLTGRKTTLTMFPVSQKELVLTHNEYDLKKQLPEWLVYGGYPAVQTAETLVQKRAVLEEILHSYLLKDILDLEQVKGSKILLDILRLLAFQIGSEVSLSEIAAKVGIDTKTVARYIDLFEKSFVIYNLRGFSRNLRTEVTKKGKYFFYDNGIRNAVIANWNDLFLRDDVGKLWENFLFMERMKKRAYDGIYANAYFWRTWDGQEIDCVEEREGKIFGYEFKWSDAKAAKEPADWKKTYPEATFEVINKENYIEFIT